MADLSKRFGERDAQMSAVDPRAAAEGRRVALRDYERARRRRLNLALAAAVAVIAAADIAYMVLSPGTPAASDPSSPVATATAQPPAPVDMAAAEPAAPPQSPTPPPQSMAAPSPVAQTSPAMDDKPTDPPAPKLAEQPSMAPPAGDLSPPVAPASASDTGQLRRDEIREVQARLRSFGFNPGPVDGSAGPMTEAAVARYQQNRAQAATGKADRQLLEELRQDPAPKVVQRNPAPTQYAAGSPAPHYSSSNSALAAIRTASDRLSQWFQSITPR